MQNPIDLLSFIKTLQHDNDCSALRENIKKYDHLCKKDIFAENYINTLPPSCKEYSKYINMYYGNKCKNKN